MISRFLMMWHFLNEKINKNDLTRKKQTELDYKINTGSKSKPPFSHSPKPHLIMRCTREREGGLALDATAMPPPSLKMVTSCLMLPPSDSHCHGGLLLHAACSALPVLPPPISGQPILGIYAFSSLQPS